MRISCLQHVPFEGPAAIAEWAATKGHPLEIARLYENQPLPRTNGFDLLLAMGGPMSVHDEALYDWLAPEKKLVRECLREGKFVLGVCLGSQLIAECLGATVYRNPVKEIGWFPVRLRAEAAGSCLAALPRRIQALHWHGETYDLPPGSAHLAESDGCRIQAFEHPSALGLQFHFETTRESLEALTGNCANEIGSGPYEQPAGEMLAGEARHGEAARAALFVVMDAIERKLAGRR